MHRPVLEYYAAAADAVVVLEAAVAELVVAVAAVAEAIMAGVVVAVVVVAAAGGKPLVDVGGEAWPRQQTQISHQKRSYPPPELSLYSRT